MGYKSHNKHNNKTNMADKKQTGGLGVNNDDLIQPGDQELDTNNLINTVQQNKSKFEGGFDGSLDILTNIQRGNSPLNPDHYKIDSREWDEYNRLIGTGSSDNKGWGNFSLSDSTIDDQRADAQGLGEKAWNATLKFFPRTATHIIGSTVGLVDGFGRVAADAYENGFAASNWNKFFNNDFQRSLDEFNKNLDDKLPHYVSSQERDLNFWQGVFGKGAANFWTDQLSQGLSFVAGAVLSELATGGAATAMIGPKAANNLKRISALRNTSYGQKAINASKNLQKINRAERIYDGLTTGRRLLTGAFYESGVEARHNYDQVVDNLSILHRKETGEPPSQEDMAKINDIAVKVSNGVFAANAALVGYSNMLLFRNVFGSGMKANKKFKNKITKDTKTGKYKAKHQDWGKTRSWLHRNVYGKGAWGRYAMYEGFVEEGGQKTADIAGQYGAESLYLNEKTPSQLQAVGEILNNTFDGMAEAYGSAEGQKEIFLGIVLAALGLPSFVHTNEKGEKSFKLGYGKVGGIKDYLNQYREGQKEVENLVKYMNENPDAMEAIKTNFDMLNGITEANDRRDYADASENDFAYKNAEHDAFFSFVFNRIKGGYFGDAMDSIEDMREMDLDSFEAMFNYEEQTQNMSKKDRENFLTERRNKVVESHIERANKIKEIYDSLDNTKLGPDAKKMMAQALSTTNDLDGREQKLIEEIEETGGFALTAVVNRVENDKQSSDNIMTRAKNFTMQLFGRKAKDVMENSEVGREVKREIGIKEFTEPGHPMIVYTRMVQRLAALKAQRDSYEQSDNTEGFVETDDKVKALEDEIAVLGKEIDNQTAPNISEEEKQILEEYRQRDPAGYEMNKEGIIEKLQDLRRIRARRHQMLNLVQQMIDPAAAKDKIQQLEEMANDMLTEEEKKNLPPEEQRLARKYKGKVIEFETTDKKTGKKTTHRVKFKDAGNNGLIRLPNEETFRLVKRKDQLLKKKTLTEDEIAELELINEELAKEEHITGLSTFDLSILEDATNIKVLTEQDLIISQLQAVTNVLQDNLAEELSKASDNVQASKQALAEIARTVNDIKAAIQEAKRNKQGSLYVNLNRIGRRGNFSVQRAQELMAELKIAEEVYKKQLIQFSEDLDILNNNSLRLQVIHTTITNPELVAKVLNKPVTRNNVLEFVNDLLGLTSLQEFYNEIGEQGFFDINELTKLAGQKNKDGNFDVDNEILQDILDLAEGPNISKEYLDLMNTDLEHFKQELELLSQHRRDVERMLNKMINPMTKEVLMFPPDGLTESDLRYLTRELHEVDFDIKTLKSIIEMMEAETEQTMLDAANSDVVQRRREAVGMQASITQSMIEYVNWITSLEQAPAEVVNDEKGETAEAQEDFIDRYSPSFTDKGWVKTAGSHAVAIKEFEKYTQMIEDDQPLTPAEQLHFQHIKSQLRFFKYSAELTNWTKDGGVRLLAVTRNNIRPEWKDKIVFFDVVKAEKSNRYDDLSNYKYSDDLLENPNNNEALEDIKLVVVDSNNEPILLDGEIIYTDMNSSSAYNAAGQFKGDVTKDQEDGELRSELVNEQESFINERNTILNDPQERYFYVTGKGRGIPIQDGSLKAAIGRLKVRKGNKLTVARDEDLKNIRLELALPAAGTKGRDARVTLFNRFSVKSGFAYIGTDTRGYNQTGNLLPAKVSNLSVNQVNNIYNLSRYFATNQEEGGINIGGKGFNTILKGQIMYGDRSKSRALQQFSIYMQEDAIFFGDQGQSITFEELQNPEKYADKHTAYKTFLSTLYFNINSTLLSKDKEARTEAIKAGKATNTFVQPEYEQFTEVIVNDDLSTNIIQWDNYTHYLLSDRDRAVEDIPAKVDIPMAFEDSNTDIEHSTVPQFLNVYLTHSDSSLTADQISNEINSIKQKSPTQKTEDKKVEETKPEGEWITVVDPQTGKQYKIKKVTDQKEAKDIMKGEVDKEDTAPDTLEGSPFSQSENVDDPYFLANMSEDRGPEINLNTELEWFNANMPKDKDGNPIVGIDMVKGLIDGKAFGKFTKDGNILLSNMLDTPGVVYHESWHAITRRFISPQERYAIYDEVRGMRGSTVTYKGDTKRMSELTDKEADEWLAEEFREYVLVGGNYNVGERIQKSLVDRIFDKILNLLNFFIGTPSQAQQLMEGINTGKFSNPNQELTIYDSNTEAYMEASKISATTVNNTMEGMTVILFNKALKSNAFELEDFINPNKIQEVAAIISRMYGGPMTSGSIYSQIEAHIQHQIGLTSDPAQIENLENTMRSIRDNWTMLKQSHQEYLKRFNIDLTDEALDEIEKVREQFGKPQNEIDPSVYLPKAVKVLLGTLPKTEQGKFVVNSSGLPQLVDFGGIMNFMYKEMSNTDPSDFVKNLENASKKRPELKSVIRRLGIESTDWSTKTSDQMRLLIQTMMQFDQSNNTFYTQLITRDGGRMLINSNQNRVEDRVKLLWTNNFKSNVQNIPGLGKDINGELILNEKAKVKVGRKNKTFLDWASDAQRTADETLQVLDRLGIAFTDSKTFTDMYNDETTNVRSAIDFILQSVNNQPVSDLFKGDVLGNLGTLINLEAQTSFITVDLQHRNPDGKTVHGINLKTFADVLTSSLNGSQRLSVLRELTKYDNLKGSVFLERMVNRGQKLNVVILQGIEQQFGRGKSLSKGSPVDIGSMMINSVLGHGIVPLLRTADKKTEYGIQFGTPSLNVTKEQMIGRLQNYLKDEIRVASKYNSNLQSKLHRIDTLKDKGGNLQFFQGVVPSLGRGAYSKQLTEEEITALVTREDVVMDLNNFLNTTIKENTKALNVYNVYKEGENGVDNRLVSLAEIRAEQNQITPQEVIGEQFTYEYLTGVIEQGKLFLGDFGLYTDLFKRTAGISGTKIYPTSNPEILSWMNENMPNLMSKKEHSNSLRVVHRAAVKTEAPYLDQYISTLSLMGMPQEFIQNVNDVYSNMEEFDGGGFITLDGYRSLMYRAGKWTAAQEEFYQKMARGEEVTPEEMAIIPPLKPQLFGPHIVDNVRLMTYHKFALFPILPGMGTNTSFGRINQDMIDNQVDYMVFESAVKVGGVTASQEFINNDNKKGYDPFYEKSADYNVYKNMSVDTDGQPLGLQELNFSDLGIQVEVAPKIKKEIPEGSQLRSLLPINVYNEGEVSEGYKDFEKLIDRYHEINNILVEKELGKLLKKLKLTKDQSGIYKLEKGNLTEFKEALISEFKKRDNPIHTVQALEELLDSDTKFIEQLFEKNKIESLLYSLVNNNVVKRKMPGSQFVLQASTGFENNLKAIKQNDFDRAKGQGVDLHTTKLKPLKFYRKEDPNNPNSETLAMQVYLPSRFKKIYDTNDPNLDADLLQVIGFRIPTEGLNSMDFIEIVGFLPPSFGDVVIVPSEIVGKAGSDYDIDKLNIYFPNSFKQDGKLKRTKLDPDKSLKQQKASALQNEIQHIIRDVLSHPVSFDQLIAPVGAYEVKKLAKAAALLRNPEQFDSEGNKIKLPLHKTFTLGNMIDTSYRMFSGLGGIGIVATSATQHAKGQRPGINWAKNHFNLFEGTGHSLSKVSDVNDTHKISSIIGEYVTGYVDVTKEDFVFDINAGIDYAPMHMLLIRSGVPLDQVIGFMSQPIIDEYVKLKEINQPLYAPFPLKKDDTIVDELIDNYGGVSSENTVLNALTLWEMVGKDINELNDVQKQIQVQILNMFVKYNELTKDLLMLKDATSLDTTRDLTSSLGTRYAKQLINRLEQDGTFNNLDELLYGNKEGASTVSGYTHLLNEVDGMFAEFKLGEYIQEAKEFIDGKLFEATDREANMFKDDVLYTMKKFESFLATYVVQNTPLDNKKLGERTIELFKGENSLPRRINALKEQDKYRDNLLIQELTPILQVYRHDSVESTIDGLRLFSKKLQSYDIDLLADAFMELKELDSTLTDDLIVFSMLQSGYEFNPNSFFQIIPGIEVLSTMSPYFKQSKREDRKSNLINTSTLEGLWVDFHKNYYSDNKVVPNVYRRSLRINNRGQKFVDMKRKIPFVSVTSPIGKRNVGGRETTLYDTKLFKYQGEANNKYGVIERYTEIGKKGIKNNLVEAGIDKASIVNANINTIQAENPDVSTTNITVKRNLGGEITQVLNYKDKGCK